MSSSVSRITRKAADKVAKGLKNRVTLDLDFVQVTISKGSARSTNEEFVEFGFTDPKSLPHQVLVPGSELMDKNCGDALTKRLAKHGMPMAIKYHGVKLVHAIDQITKADAFQVVQQLGWLDQDAKAYILPNKIYAKNPGSLRYSPAGGMVGVAQSNKGTLKEWKDNVGKYLVDNKFLLFVLGLVVGSILLGPRKYGSVMIQFVGPSSIGKSLVLKIASSIFGLKRGSWNSTVNALESQAASHLDMVMTIDETGHRSNKEDIFEAVYRLMGDAMKDRMGGEFATKGELRTVMLSSSNFSCMQMAEKKKIDLDESTLVRLVDVFADLNNGWGIFHNLHGFEKSKELWDLLHSNCERYSGAVMDHILTEFVNEMGSRQEVRLGWLKERAEKYKSAARKRGLLVERGASTRIGDAFCLAYEGLRLAVKYKVIDVPAKDCLDAILFAHGRVMHEDIGSVEQRHDNLLREVAETIREISTDFVDIAKLRKGDIDPSAMPIGYTSRNKGDVECYMLREEFVSTFCKVKDPSYVLGVLEKNGWLVADKEKTGTMRYVLIDDLTTVKRRRVICWRKSMVQQFNESHW